MKTLLILAGSLCATTYAGAQEIAPVKTTFEDMEVVLNQAGFESYAYDLSSFLEGDTRYDVAIRIKEYDGGKELDNDRVFHLGPTRMLLNDIPEEYRAEIPDSVMLDSERGILRESGRLVLGRYPSGVDSVARWVFHLENGGRGSRVFADRSEGCGYVREFAVLRLRVASVREERLRVGEVHPVDLLRVDVVRRAVRDFPFLRRE